MSDWMEKRLAKSLNLSVPALHVQDERQYDALRSAWALLQGLTGAWSRDLHSLPVAANEEVVSLCELAHYFWP